MSAGRKETELLETLRAVIRGRVMVLGLGNWMRGDDGAGCAVADRLASVDPAVACDAGVAPENYLGRIRRARPDTLLVVDAADFGAEPGSIGVFGMDELRAGGFSTHAPSLAVFREYVAALGIGRVHLVGIQPTSTTLGEGMSPPVVRAVVRLCRALEACLPPASVPRAEGGV